MKQTQMYVCTLEEFILVDVDSLLYMDEVRLHELLSDVIQLIVHE